MEASLLPLLECMYGSLLSPDGLVVFLRKMEKATASGSVFVLELDTTRSVPMRVVSSAHDEATCARFIEQFAKCRERHWFDRGEKLQRAGAVLNGIDLASAEEIKSSDYYDIVLRDLDVLHSTAVCGPMAMHHQCMLMVNRSEAQGPFREEELPLLRAFAPHWVVFCQLYRRLPMRGATAPPQFGSRGTAVFELGPGFELRRQNHTGEHCIEQGWLSRTPEGQLRMRDAHTQSDWITAQRSAASGNSEPPPFAIHGASGELVAYGALQASTDGRLLARQLLFIRPVHPLTTDLDLSALLRDTHGLTAAEAALATALRQQETLVDAAKSLGITAGTARQRLQSVFEKMQVHRQTELFLALDALGELGDHRYRPQAG